MSNINLLPWREDLKQKKQKDFFALLFVVCLMAFGLAYAGKLYMDGQISKQTGRNDFLQQEMAVLDRKIKEIQTIKEKKAELEKRINLIQELQERRNLTTRLLNTLPLVTPPGVYLTNMQFSDDKISINGNSESNSRLAKMMRNVDASLWLGDTYIGSIVATDSAPIKLSKFNMNFSVMAVDGAVNKGGAEQ